MILGYKENVAAKIIETALEIYATKGYSNLTMDEIAETLRISKGALYSYFKSKDDIIREIYKSSSTAMQTILADASKEGNFKQAMETVFTLTSGKYRNHICIYFETFAIAWHEENLKMIMKLQFDGDLEATRRFVEGLSAKTDAKAEVDCGVLAHLFRAVWMETAEKLGLGYDSAKVYEEWIVQTTLIFKAT